MRISLSVAAMVLATSACSTTAPPAVPPMAHTALPPSPSPAPSAPTASAARVAAATPAENPNAPPAPLPDAVTSLLSYAERVRPLNPAELAAEIALQGDPGNAPLRQMQLAVALMHSPHAADTARALGLLQRVMGHPAAEAVALKPLARLLGYPLAEQRRLEETAERQSQQLRDHQRRIDQLSDRLEAMRAIERSLTTRPPAAPNRPRNPQP